jgi:hypothetical protein
MEPELFESNEHGVKCFRHCQVREITKLHPLGSSDPLIARLFAAP